MKMLRCRTDGCPNADVAIPWDDEATDTEIDDAEHDSGVTVTLAPPVCGCCAKPIADVDDFPELIPLDEED